MTRPEAEQRTFERIVLVGLGDVGAQVAVAVGDVPLPEVEAVAFVTSAPAVRTRLRVPVVALPDPNVWAEVEPEAVGVLRDADLVLLVGRFAGPPFDLVAARLSRAARQAGSRVVAVQVAGPAELPACDADVAFSVADVQEAVRALYLLQMLAYPGYWDVPPQVIWEHITSHGPRATFRSTSGQDVAALTRAFVDGAPTALRSAAVAVAVVAVDATGHLGVEGFRSASRDLHRLLEAATIHVGFNIGCGRFGPFLACCLAVGAGDERPIA